MRSCKPVTVSKQGFIFCKFTVAILLWLGFFFRIKWIVVLSFIILGLSALFKIRRAPLIVIYNYTFGKLFKSKEEMLDEHAMRFTHTLGSILTFICIIFLYLINAKIGWVIVFFVAIAKTLGALGFCTALKLYGCMTSGTCCRTLKKKHNDR